MPRNPSNMINGIGSTNQYVPMNHPYNQASNGLVNYGYSGPSSSSSSSSSAMPTSSGVANVYSGSASLYPPTNNPTSYADATYLSTSNYMTQPQMPSNPYNLQALPSSSSSNGVQGYSLNNLQLGNQSGQYGGMGSSTVQRIPNQAGGLTLNGPPAIRAVQLPTSYEAVKRPLSNMISTMDATGTNPKKHRGRPKKVVSSTQVSTSAYVPAAIKKIKAPVANGKKKIPGPVEHITNTLPSLLHPSTYIQPVNCPPMITAKMPTPPNWLDNVQDTDMSLNTYKTYNICPTTAEYQAIANMVQPIQIKSIEQIVNPELWDRFVKARTDMMRSKCDDLKILQKLGLSEQEVMRRAHLSYNYEKDPQIIPYSDNMVMLFHCTRSSANHKSILAQGLDERLSSISGGLLGKGIYFADDPNKSLQYDGTGYIFIFAVLLGDCISVDHFPNKSALVREPEKVKQQMRNFNDHFFDSIVARPGQYNEYVIYNRYQCCPIYQVKYVRGAIAAGPAVTNFNLASRTLPPLAWIPEGPNYAIAMPIQDQSVNWPFFAVDIFNTMGVKPPTDDDEEEIVQIPPDSHSKTIDDNLAELINMGYTDEAKNREILERFNNDMSHTLNFLLDNASVDSNDQGPTNTATTDNSLPTPSNAQPDEAVEADGIETIDQAPTITSTLNKSIVTIDLVDDSDCSLDVTADPFDIIDITDLSQLCSRQSETLPEDIAEYALEFGMINNAPPQMEECPICCNEYRTPSAWHTLDCSHKLCLACYSKMLTRRCTMSGIQHTFIKCPFCSRCTGTEIGTCPDMQMNVAILPSSCDGYFPSTTICINYLGNCFHRAAYLPNNVDGQKVLELLKTAFERRLVFTIGTSNTTGRENVIVWNIHHKTAISGGVSSHGYPDPQYLGRVKEELKSFGIE